MKTITLQEANQQFSRLIRALEQEGEGFVITRRGLPVARLLPHGADLDSPKRAAARRHLLKRLRKGAHLGGRRVKRDELHER